MKNHRCIGYIRLSRAGPSLDAQKAALRKAAAAAGKIKSLFIDDIPGTDAAAGGAGKNRVAGRTDERFPERAAAIESLKPGDHLVIATPSRLGASRGDILKTLEAIGAKGAMLYVESLGRSFAWTLALAEFTSLVERDNDALVAEKMRARKTETGARSGPKPKLVEGTPRWDQARDDWANPKRKPEAVAKKFGVSIPTLYRRFGPKG